METEQKKNRFGAYWILALLLVLICVASVVYLFRGAVYNGLDALKLIPTPERFTELYFTDPGAIPSSVTSGKPISFTFTIANQEGVTTTYPYSSYFMDTNGHQTLLASGTVTIANEASTTISVSHTFIASAIAGKVVVALPSINDQQIDFLLPYTN